jgi:hypothetical protein
MKRILKITAIVTGLILITSSCIKNLDMKPIDPDIVTADVAFEDPEAYTQFLAKCYAGLAVSGQQGPAGQGDISGIDEGFGQYLRGYWYHQELTTDEAVIGWDDATIKDFHYQQWGDGDGFIAAFYYRIFYQISLTNEFLRQTTDDKLNDRGVTDEWRAKIKTYRAEARWLRALSYWHALDLFGSVPFAVETDPVGEFNPPQISAADLFAWLETELNEMVGDMTEPRANEYGRADKAAVWALQAKLYLNAEVYIGESKYTECLTACNNIIGSNYALAPTFEQLFWANNDMDATTMQEIIFPIRFDGQHTQTWGGTTFIIHAAVGGDMTPGTYGIDGGWGGTRTTRQLVEKFGPNDGRAKFWTEGQSIDIENIGDFYNGYAVVKFTNTYIEDGVVIEGNDLTFPDTDFPMFRLGDVYLMYAEAVLRGGTGGDIGTATNYINALRDRVSEDNINSGDVTLPFIIDERARELYWECHRRTDLVRFNQLTGGEYIWAWKGNSMEGRATEAKYNQFPLPSADVNANPNLTQNPNY